MHLSTERRVVPGSLEQPLERVHRGHLGGVEVRPRGQQHAIHPIGPVDAPASSPPSRRPRLSCTARIASIAEGAQCDEPWRVDRRQRVERDAAPAPPPSQALPIALSAGATPPPPPPSRAFVPPLRAQT